MKTYIKPNLNQINISVNKEIAAGLNDWLTTNGMSAYTETITTYAYNS